MMKPIVNDVKTSAACVCFLLLASLLYTVHRGCARATPPTLLCQLWQVLHVDGPSHGDFHVIRRRRTGDEVAMHMPLLYYVRTHLSGAHAHCTGNYIYMLVGIYLASYMLVVTVWRRRQIHVLWRVCMQVCIDLLQHARTSSVPVRVLPRVL